MNDVKIFPSRYVLTSMMKTFYGVSVKLLAGVIDSNVSVKNKTLRNRLYFI